MIDVNAIRDPNIRLHGLDKVDDIYTIYYDETNNIRRLHVTPNGLNVRKPNCYVLGGIAHRGSVRDFSVDALRSALKIQKSANEIKLKHLGKGGFLDLLRSTNVETFLNWMANERLFIHYQVLDVIYWSIVDIVDSILAEVGHTQFLMNPPALKDDLYKILRYDLDDTVQMFKRFSYPDVGRVRRSAFVNELKNLLEKRRHLLPDFNSQMLNGLLEMAANLESLPFLEDEKPNVLLDEFSMFYIKNICLFKNSAHILDIEEVIEARLTAEIFVDNGRPVRNYQFVDSKHVGGVQIADVAVGLLGKLFTFLNRTELHDLRDVRAKLSSTQSRNLSRLTDVMNLSISENAAFAHYVLSYEDQRRAAFFLGV